MREKDTKVKLVKIITLMIANLEPDVESVINKSKAVVADNGAMPNKISLKVKSQ